MKPLDFIAVKLALLLVSGVLLGHLLNISSLTALLFSSANIVVLGIVHILSNRKSVIFGVCVVITTLSTGILSYSLSREINHTGHYQ
ncbi:MAG: hypothetical protein KJO90_05975, partial [Eudoraea sp.]|nr:hypothetical protein [Eudoraea sp.]